MKPRNHCSSTRKVTTVIIGGGHAGLATSHCLTERSIDHVVLERGEVANSWRHERWDSLRLLTPNWQSRLPGYQYDGVDPDGFMTMPQVIAFIERYAANSSAPVYSHTRVTAVSPTDEGFRVECGAAARTAAIRDAGFSANMDHVDRIFHHLVDDSSSWPDAVALPALVSGGGDPL